MKILLFTLEYPPFHGGVASYYGNLVKYWPEEADEILVLNNNQDELLSGRFPLGWIMAAFKLRQIIKTKKISHVLAGQILPLGTAALICSKFCKIKYSVILHGMDLTYAVKTWRKKFISKSVLAGAEKIICANSYVAGLARETFPGLAPKITVVNPGVEIRSTSQKLMAQLKAKHNLLGKIILLSVGRLVKRKGFDKVIESMPDALKQAPNLIYIIIGGGQERKNFKLKISNLKLEKNIFIITQAADEERNAWYDLCDIFIMPSRNIRGDFEGFGIVYLEANLAGKPVIAGRSGGAGDAVIDGLNGLLVDPEDNEKISQAIVKLAISPELRKQLGERGRARAIQDFSWRKQAKKIYNAIIM